MKSTMRLLVFLGITALVLMLALTIGSGTTVSAAGTVPNDIPATAAEIDGQPHEIPGNVSLWYKFDYGLTHSEGVTQGEPVTIILNNGNKMGVGFDVYTPAQILKWWDEDPIGRGTPQSLTTGNLPVLYNGDHLSNDLLWVGRFPVAGTYFVKVNNENAFPVTFTLFSEGSALR